MYLMLLGAFALGVVVDGVFDLNGVLFSNKLAILLASTTIVSQKNIPNRFFSIFHS